MSTELTPAQHSLVLKIGTDALELPPAETVLGRAGHAGEAQPDVSLDQFGAQQKGVSRRHVRIRWQNAATLATDLGSSNGTWLNGKRLKPAAEYELRNGDELVLGKLSMIVKFSSATLG